MNSTGQWVGGANENRGPTAAVTYEWMEQCAPYAAHVRAKFFMVAEERGESWLDYERIVRILDAAGFNGTLGIVFEGGDVNQGISDREVFAIAAAELQQLTAAWKPPRL